MTREEEIHKLIDEETGIDNYGSSDYQIGVCDGVRLADKTMLNRACEWLNKIFFQNPFLTKKGIVSRKYDTMEEFITAFKQAMKGGAE